MSRKFLKTLVVALLLATTLLLEPVLLGAPGIVSAEECTSTSGDCPG